MVFLVRALMFLLQTALNASGMTMTLTSRPTPPEGGKLLGSAPALAQPPCSTRRWTSGECRPCSDTGV